MCQGYAPPPKNGVEQKRPGRPLNITSLVRLSSAVPNQISVTWAPEIGKVIFQLAFAFSYHNSDILTIFHTLHTCHCFPDLLHVCVFGAAADITVVTTEIKNEGNQEPRPLEST